MHTPSFVRRQNTPFKQIQIYWQSFGWRTPNGRIWQNRSISAVYFVYLSQWKTDLAMNYRNDCAYRICSGYTPMGEVAIEEGKKNCHFLKDAWHTINADMTFGKPITWSHEMVEEDEYVFLAVCLPSIGSLMIESLLWHSNTFCYDIS